MNSMSWVSHDLDLRKPCCRRYRILLSSPWSMILLATICSIILQQTLVSDIDLQFSAWKRQSSGTSLVCRDFLYISKRSGPTSSASSFRTLGPRLSGPGDLVGFRSSSSLTTPLRVMSMFSIYGNWSSVVGM